MGRVWKLNNREKELLVNSLKADLEIVLNLLEDEKNLSKLNQDCQWWSVNKNNTELRHRLRGIRRDSIKLERMM